MYPSSSFNKHVFNLNKSLYPLRLNIFGDTSMKRLDVPAWDGFDDVFAWKEAADSFADEARIFELAGKDAETVKKEKKVLDTRIIVMLLNKFNGEAKKFKNTLGLAKIDTYVKDDVVDPVRMFTSAIAEHVTKSNLALALDKMKLWSQIPRDQVYEQALLFQKNDLLKANVLRSLLDALDETTLTALPMDRDWSVDSLVEWLKKRDNFMLQIRGIDLIKQPFKTLANVNTTKETPRCYYCKQIGHVRKDCSKWLNGKPRKFRNNNRREDSGRKEWRRKPKKETINVMGLSASCIIRLAGWNVEALIDTGASISVISEDLVKKYSLKAKLSKLPETLTVMWGGTPIEAKEALFTRIGFARETVKARLIVVPKFPYKVLLGMDTLRFTKLDLANNKLEIGKSKISIKTWSSREVNVVTGGSKETDLVDEMVGRCSNLAAGQQEELRNLLRRFSQCFANSLESCAKARVEPVSIKLVEGAKAKFIPNRRLSLAEKDIINKEVEKMISSGAIKPMGLSPNKEIWNSPIVLVKKKDGTIRFCIDYKYLNSQTRDDKHPLPRIDDLLDRIKCPRFISHLDFVSGYWQVPVAEEDQYKLAFSTENGYYTFQAMPFGIKNAPSIFQKTLGNLLGGIDGVLVYLDDVIIFNNSWQEHLDTLAKVLSRIKEAQFVCKAAKCEFGKNKAVLLGYEVSSDGLRPNPEKVEAIIKMAEPKNTEEVATFLGMVDYYRNFIRNCAELQFPLRLAAKQFTWGEEQKVAFQKLKEKLANLPTLAAFQPDLPLEVHVDASNVGIGGVLVQIRDGKEIPIQFYSRTLNKAEQNYPTLKKELLALHNCVKKFRPYLFGRNFVAYTDHKPLIGFLKNQNIEHSPIIARMILYLGEFMMDLRYRKGKENADADALSRLPAINFLVDVGNWRMAQRNDARLRKMMKEIRKGKETRFKLVEGILLTNDDRPVVPETLKLQIMLENHNSDFGGHMGPDKTILAVKKHYFWHGMDNDIKEFCNRCTVCIQKSKFKKEHGIPANIEFGGPWECIALDAVGPFPISRRGNRYLLVAIDIFTKNVEVRATPRITAEETTDFLLAEVVARHGVPRTILTDNGKNFIANSVKSMYENLGIKGKLATPYNPQGNGVVERFNRTLGTLLRLSNGGHENRWDEKLPACLFAYRKTPHAATKESPFFLEYGREPCLPLESLGLPSKNYGIEDYKETLMEKLNLAWEEVEKELRLSQKKINERLEKERKRIKLQIGDLVWIHVEQSDGSRKLYWTWKGPARVIDKYSDQVYKVQNIRDGKIYQKVNIRRLRPFDQALEVEDSNFVPNIVIPQRTALLHAGYPSRTLAEGDTNSTTAPQEGDNGNHTNDDPLEANSVTEGRTNGANMASETTPGVDPVLDKFISENSRVIRTAHGRIKRQILDHFDGKVSYPAYHTLKEKLKKSDVGSCKEVALSWLSSIQKKDLKL